MLFYLRFQPKTQESPVKILKKKPTPKWVDMSKAVTFHFSEEHQGGCCVGIMLFYRPLMTCGGAAAASPPPQDMAALPHTPGDRVKLVGLY